jgi:hypothetical protein
MSNIGKDAFEGLKAGDFQAFLQLTPHVEGPLKQVCGEAAEGVDLRELEARFEFCHRKIAWSQVTDVRVGGGEPLGRRAHGCTEEIDDLGRLQMVVHLPKTRWQVDFQGALGRAGKLIGLGGEISCREL